MTFVSHAEFHHDAPERLGVLLVNLGTPDAPTVPAVRRYLAEFLADPRVVELPRALWLPILHGVILRVRPARSAKAYQSVWAEDGSPLLTIAQRQAAAVQERFDQRLPGAVKVALGMRYGNPSIPAALAQLRQANVRRLLVFPLYPQYSGSTTASVFDAVTRELSRWRWLPETRFINQYHDHPGYIAAIVESIRAHWSVHGQPERLLFSFHGIPKDYFDQGDPYYCHCQKTARLITDQLALPPESWSVTFQSRVGFKEWLQPYTDETLKSWGAAGIRSVQVLSPGFSADCLETIEEIDEENRGYFLGAGGEHFSYIHCLNDAPKHIDMMVDLITRHAMGWPELEGSVLDETERHARRERALALGAVA
ncbi:ferrochelatase [Thiocapsa imhoffii]|uniref:Ferrochelatase n=1 Tax=Thiocapsa imhoffii TaxID=382777 RepID=A0A9X0WH98_9GAMM|nr:ferrochelatase [Thiocapsa imhoffii]MBK1644684.1 ferrochelatase [Thiocapsa imhoffii]